jgi:ketosteroid isomerase-like protein
MTEIGVERELRAMLQEWADAYGRKDADAYAAMFSDRDDVIVFGTGADEVRVGPQEIAERECSFALEAKRKRRPQASYAGSGSPG